MGTMCKATAKVCCWKEHTCSACATVYRYRFEKKAIGWGGTEEAAKITAQKMLVRSLERHVAPRPCPKCGLVQGDMIGKWRALRHFFTITLAFGALAVMILLGVFDFNKPILLWITTGLAGAMLLTHWTVVSRRFNDDLEANRSRSQRLIAEGSLQITAEGSSDSAGLNQAEESVREKSAAGIFLVMLVLSALIPLAEIVRNACDWPWNPDWHPAVAGPGDRPYIWFPSRINCLKGYWNGRAGARLLNSAELRLANDSIQAETNTETWGQSISAKAGELDSAATPWVRIVVPEIPQSRGKKLIVDMILNVKFPVAAGANKFDVRGGLHSHTAELVLADPGAGQLYVNLFWFCGIGAFGLAILESCLLVPRAYHLSNSANPTKVYPMDSSQLP